MLSVLQRSSRVTQVFRDKLCSILCWDLRNYCFCHFCKRYSISALQKLPLKSAKTLLRIGGLGTSLLCHLPHHPVHSKKCSGEGWSAAWLISSQKTAPKSYWTVWLKRHSQIASPSLQLLQGSWKGKEKKKPPKKKSSVWRQLACNFAYLMAAISETVFRWVIWRDSLFANCILGLKSTYSDVYSTNVQATDLCLPCISDHPICLLPHSADYYILL